MDIKKLQLFIDVSETKNFTKSGERMGYTQSGVSHILKSLEMDMGFPLFIRKKQGVKLTQNAEIVLPMVRSLLFDYDKLEKTVNELNGLEKGKLEIATFSSISINWMPSIINQFQKKYPGIDINLREGGADDILKWLEEETVDFAFMSIRNVKTMKWIPLYEDPLMAVLPKDYPPPNSNVFQIEKFEGEKFIISARGIDYDVRYALEKSGVKPDITHFSATDDHTIIAMVANKLGVSILPQLILRNFDVGISSYLLEPNYSRKLGIVYKFNLSPAAVKFVEAAKHMLSEPKTSQQTDGVSIL